MAQILGIHGIAQQFTGGPKLTSQWWFAIRGGLETAGYRATADALDAIDVRVVFYGDLFRPSGTKAGGQPPYTVNQIEPGPERELLEEWYEEAVAQAIATGSKPGTTKGPISATKQTMLNLLLQSPTLAGVAERAFIGNLKQVTAFLADPDVKNLVLQRTAAEVTADTKVVIGHSLGSVVAYEYLALYAPPQVELLITVGSPLGMPRLVFHRLTPNPTSNGGTGAWPGTVSRWVNIADENDVVALRKQLAPLFPPPAGAMGVEDHLVNNGNDPHGIEPYLTSRMAGQALFSVL